MVTPKLFVQQRLSCIDGFERWLHETEIWQCLRNLDKKKQGPALCLFHNDNIRKKCNDIKVNHLNSDDVDILMDKLKSLFFNPIEFIAYHKFEASKYEYRTADFIKGLERL